MLRIVAYLRPDEADVIITQLPAAQEINATWLSTVDTFGHPSAVSIRRGSGCQLSAPTRPRLPSAKIMAALTNDCLLTNAQPIRRPVASPRRPAITHTINQMPLRGEPARSTSDRRGDGRAGR